jgi:hypothetical protein
MGNLLLCTGAFLYACYSFLLISNKFCDLSLLHWPLFRAVQRCGGGGGGSAIRKIYCTGRVPRAHVHKTTYGHLIDTALVMDLPASKAGPYKS